jgi:serine protease Do
MRRFLTILLVLLILIFAVSVKIDAQSTAIERENVVKRILEKVSPSIVKVVAENHKQHIASGVAIAPDRVISTLLVVREPYQRIFILTVDGKTYPARVLGKDNETSLLLLDIGQKALKPLSQAKQSEAGDWAALVGVFYRKFPAIYQGIISSVSDEELIVNGPVTPGSPGGAIINKKGELMGIIRGGFGYALSPDYIYKDHVAEFSIRSTRNRQRDLCYSIPITKVNAYAKDLEKFGKVQHGWLGVSLDEEYAPDNLIIGTIAKNSPAEKAGLRRGDKLLSIEGKPIHGSRDVIRMVKALKPGQKTRIEFQRGVTRKSTMAVIGEFKERFQWSFATAPGENLFIVPEMGEPLPRLENFVFSISGARTLGVDVVAMTPELAREFHVKEGNGLMISKVYKDTAADKAGIQPADIIVKIGDRDIKRSADMRTALRDLQNNDPLLLYVYRKGDLRKITVIPDDNTKRFFGVFDRIINKIQNFQVNIDESSRAKVNQARTQRVSEANEGIETDELKRYKEELERMKKEQQRLKDELEQMRKRIEAAEKNTEKKKEQKKKV